VTSSKFDVVTGFIEALNAGELDEVLADTNWDPDIELLDFPDIPGRRLYRGLSGVREFFSDLTENWAKIKIEVDEIREVEGKVLVLGTQTSVGALQGTPVTSDFAELVDFDGERVARVRLFRDRDQAREAAGA
jgi:ketosteroid isomerase-like protein